MWPSVLSRWRWTPKPTAGVGKDKRAAIDLQFAREVLSRDGSQIRWVDGRYQLADDLTKLRDGDLIRAARLLPS